MPCMSPPSRSIASVGVSECTRRGTPSDSSSTGSTDESTGVMAGMTGSSFGPDEEPLRSQLYSGQSLQDRRLERVGVHDRRFDPGIRRRAARVPLLPVGVHL